MLEIHDEHAAVIVHSFDSAQDRFLDPWSSCQRCEEVASQSPGIMYERAVVSAVAVYGTLLAHLKGCSTRSERLQSDWTDRAPASTGYGGCL
jgi:hypothetical protein